jgi:protein ImuA
METSVHIATIDALRDRIQRLEGGARHRRAVLPFGIKAIDERLPGGGLALGALHEVAGGGNGTVDGAAAALFAAGIAARTRGRVLWCVSRQDLFAPALAQAGLAPDRVIYLEAGDEKSVLACFEEGLRHGELGAVVAEVARLSMTASRRLQLAAEGSGTIGLALRRWRHQAEAADFGLPTAATTRWRVSVLLSTPLPVPGIGRARWGLELIRCRGGGAATFELEACDAKGRLALASTQAYRPTQAARART